MDGRLAGDVRVLAGGQVNPLHQAEPGQQLERAEDGGPANHGAAAARGSQHVLRGEVSAALRNQLGTMRRAPVNRRPARPREVTIGFSVGTRECYVS